MITFEVTKKLLKSNIANIPGWTTKRKIVIFESDDWGSIRMPSLKVRKELEKKGFSFEGQSFNSFDSLESNEDLHGLFEILSKHKDKNGNHPVFTAVSILGNPDFDKIKSNNFLTYYYEPFTDTLKKYPNRDSVVEIYKQGFDEKLFYPVFHGREHLNAQRWLRKLQEGNISFLEAFNHGVTGISRGINNEYLGGFQAAFDIESLAELPFMATSIIEGIEIFEKLWGRNPRYFVPPNGPINNTLLPVLKSQGIEYVLMEKKQIEPLGNGKFKTNYHFPGKKNKYHQTYLCRNAHFEPSISEQTHSNNPIENCLMWLNAAFRWHKPAIISTHRVNYIGSIDHRNRDNSLRLLDQLINQIKKQWPEVEFMTSVELGDLINGK